MEFLDQLENLVNELQQHSQIKSFKNQRVAFILSLLSQTISKLPTTSPTHKIIIGSYLSSAKAYCLDIDGYFSKFLKISCPHITYQTASRCIRFFKFQSQLKRKFGQNLNVTTTIALKWLSKNRFQV